MHYGQWQEAACAFCAYEAFAKTIQRVGRVLASFGDAECMLVRRDGGAPD